LLEPEKLLGAAEPTPFIMVVVLATVQTAATRPGRKSLLIVF
jgi:hypothetical protein